MRKYAVVVMLLCTLLVGGCAKNIDYTKKDADALLAKRGISAVFVREEDKPSAVSAGGGASKEDAEAALDTYYTYRDRNGIEFQVIESRLLHGIDATRYTASSLETNYGYVLAEHYLTDPENPMETSGEIERLVYHDQATMRMVGLIYVFHGRAELQALLDEHGKTLGALRRLDPGCCLRYTFTDGTSWTKTTMDTHAKDVTFDAKGILAAYDKTHRADAADTAAAAN